MSRRRGLPARISNHPCRFERLCDENYLPSLERGVGYRGRYFCNGSADQKRPRASRGILPAIDAFLLGRDAVPRDRRRIRQSATEFGWLLARQRPRFDERRRSEIQALRVAVRVIGETPALHF